MSVIGLMKFYTKCMYDIVTEFCKSKQYLKKYKVTNV